MIRFSILGILLALAAPLHADTAQEAQAAWDQRDQKGQTERSIALWTKALQEDPKRGDIYISLTKACGRAYRHAEGKKDRRHWAVMARDFGAKAIEANPKNSNAHAAYAEALGQWAQAYKGLAGLQTVKRAV